MTAPWLAIVGIGEDGHLPPAARAAVAGAALVVGGRRHLALADGAITGARLAWPSPMADAYPAILARRGQPVAVLASGDPYCFGVGATLAALVPAAETVCHPAPSAFALARARLGWAEAAELSACGRPLGRHDRVEGRQDPDGQPIAVDGEGKAGERREGEQPAADAQGHHSMAACTRPNNPLGRTSSTTIRISRLNAWA